MKFQTKRLILEPVKTCRCAEVQGLESSDSFRSKACGGWEQRRCWHRHRPVCTLAAQQGGGMNGQLRTHLRSLQIKWNHFVPALTRLLPTTTPQSLPSNPAPRPRCGLTVASARGPLSFWAHSHFLPWQLYSLCSSRHCACSTYQ